VKPFATGSSVSPPPVRDEVRPAPSGWLVARADAEGLGFGFVLPGLADFVGVTVFAGALVGAGVGVAFGGAVVGRGVGVAATVGRGVGGRVGAGVGVGVGVGVAFGLCVGFEVGGAKSGTTFAVPAGVDAASTGAPRTIATARAAINDAIRVPILFGMVAGDCNDHGSARGCRPPISHPPPRPIGGAARV
jgi:hypothetical protein